MQEIIENKPSPYLYPRFSFTLFILLCFQLVGCGNLLSPVSIRETHIYQLEQTANIQLAEQPSNYSLMIAKPQASPGYNTDRMRYVKTPYQLQSFEYNRWLTSPASMVAPLLLQSMQNTGYFRHVLLPPQPVLSDFTLETNILSFQQDFQNSPSQVQVILWAMLVDNKNERIVADSRFSVSLPTKADTPYAGVIAANQAWQQVLTQVSRFAVSEIKNYQA